MRSWGPTLFCLWLSTATLYAPPENQCGTSYAFIAPVLSGTERVARVESLRRQIETLQLPAHGAATAEWNAHVRTLLRDYYTALELAVLTPEGYIYLQRELMAQVGEWRQPERYPMGLDPQTWQPLAPHIHSAVDFYRLVTNRNENLSNITRNQMTIVIGSLELFRMEPTQASLDRFRRHVFSLATIRVLGEHINGTPTDNQRFP